PPPQPTPSPYTTPFRSLHQDGGAVGRPLAHVGGGDGMRHRQAAAPELAQEPELGEAADAVDAAPEVAVAADGGRHAAAQVVAQQDRKSTRLNSSHVKIS